MRLIDISEIRAMDFPSYSMDGVDVVQYLRTLPSIDLVFCRECKLHGNCFAEDHFNFAGIENPFCCAGKRKEGADNA